MKRIFFILISTSVLCDRTKKNRDKSKLDHLYRSRNLLNPAIRRSGVWGPWSQWSSCSRSCGSGVTTQTRECVTDPVSTNRIERVRSSNNGQSSVSNSCLGQYKRFHFCNKKRCPGKKKDFRSEQCAAFNKKSFMGKFYEWQPFFQGINNCDLKCRPKRERFYATFAPAVVDGTTCDPGVKDRVCVGGVCKLIGCDGVIGSDKKWDHCGVCGGDNSTCRIVSGLYTMPQLPYGYNLIATIPKGACNINITEMRASQNYLALRHLNGSYILNGNWAINWSGSFEVVGTSFEYLRDDATSGVESLLAKGPTTGPVDMMILSQQANLGIKYEYTLPLQDATSEWPSLVHSPHQLTPTAASYPQGHHRVRGWRNERNRTHHGRHRDHRKRGQGQETLDTKDLQQQTLGKVQQQTLNKDLPQQTFISKDQEQRTISKDLQRPSKDGGNGIEETPVLDQGVDTRKDHEKTVLDQPADDPSVGPFEWKASKLTECTRTCGGGTQKSVLTCVKSSSLTAVDDHNCDPSLRPEVTTSRCNTRPCPPEWTVAEWGACSASCGEGTQRREASCKQMVTSVLVITVSDSTCSGPKPEVNQKCDAGPCLFSWKPAEWKQCSVKCGIGIRSRDVPCVDLRGIEAGEGACDQGSRPASEETCDAGSCYAAGAWFLTDWSSQCFAECGQGTQLRKVYCLDPSGVVAENCNAASKPSATKPCNSNKSCLGKWFAGPWQSCSSSCGPGLQVRDVVCLSLYRGQYKVAVDSMCAGLEKPPSEQQCNVGPCRPEWYTSEWSQCSKSCDTGLQTREAKCLDEFQRRSEGCDPSKAPAMRRSCTVAKCSSKEAHAASQADSACMDKYNHCRLVVQSRLCSYSYYRNVCCYSCYKYR